MTGPVEAISWKTPPRGKYLQPGISGPHSLKTAIDIVDPAPRVKLMPKESFHIWS
jgi:hypothetical protein